MALERLGLGGGVAAIGLDPLQPIACGGEPVVVVVELLGQMALRGARLGQLGPGGVEPARSLLGGSAAASARRSASSRAAPVAPEPEAPTRQPLRPKRSPSARDDDGLGMGERHVDRLDPATVDHDGGADQAVEQLLDLGASGPDVATQRLTLRRRRALQARGTERRGPHR